MGLSSPCTHRHIDRFTVLNLIISHALSVLPLLPSSFTRSPFHTPLFIHSDYILYSLPPKVSVPYSTVQYLLCVVGEELLEAEGVLLLRVDRVPQATGEVDPRMVLPQLGHVPSVRHHLEEREPAILCESTALNTGLFIWNLWVRDGPFLREWVTYDER